jgi:hypothetical protein
MTFLKRLARDASLAAAAVLAATAFMAFFAGAQAQPQPDRRQLHRELAHAKAERLARLAAFYRAPTAGQDDYDVTYYELNIVIDPTSGTIEGTVEVTAQVVNPTSVVDLDLANTLTVSQVVSPAGTHTFTHTDEILSVTLDRTYTTGESFSLSIDYSGPPDPSYGAFAFDYHEGEYLIWTLSEPFGARSWWPCKDVPSDKADSVNINIAVPRGMIVASNGTLRRIDNGKANDMYRWHEGYPIATYLVSVAAYPYTVFSHWYHYSPLDSMEVRYYVFPDHYDDVQETYAKTVPMIELYASLFGEYPFLGEKYGHGASDHHEPGIMERVPDRARAGPPVVGRPDHVQRFPSHLDERGIRHLHRGAVVGVHVRRILLPSGYGGREILRLGNDLRSRDHRLEPHLPPRALVRQGIVGAPHAPPRGR